MQRAIFFFLISFAFIQGAEVAYEVRFEGVEDASLLALLQKASETVSLQKRPPNTYSGLTRRVQNDIPNLIAVLRSFAYYNACIEWTIDKEQISPLVIFSIDPGQIYPLMNYRIVTAEEGEHPFFSYSGLNLQKLGICIGSPAYSKSILEAEQKFLALMEQFGYPLAKVLKRDVIADQENKALYVTLTVDSGPLARFGESEIKGSKCVRLPVFLRKIAWRRGQVYDPCLVDETLSSLEGSGLFSSIAIYHPDEIEEGDELPMTIEVNEAKHRSIGIGFSYTLVRGMGGSFEWEHRNISGYGDTLRLKTNLWQRDQEAIIAYIKPDFCSSKQDLILSAELQNEIFEPPYTSVTLSAILEKTWSSNLRTSYGISYKFLRDPETSINNYFHLIKFPFEYRFNNTDNLLNPTRGQTLTFRTTPSISVLDPQFAYSINTIYATTYYQLRQNFLVLAFKGALGSIFGSSRGQIPKSERFYMGSENTLRGYHYHKVSPLDNDNEPTGGRSLILLSTELRARLSEQFGLVGFYDVGNVYKDVFLNFNEHLLQGAGIGVRYFTPVGPIRVDLAFPLNRRKEIDGPYQIYIGIGQTF